MLHGTVALIGQLESRSCCQLWESMNDMEIVLKQAIHYFSTNAHQLSWSSQNLSKGNIFSLYSIPSPYLHRHHLLIIWTWHWASTFCDFFLFFLKLTIECRLLDSSLHYRSESGEKWKEEGGKGLNIPQCSYGMGKKGSFCLLFILEFIHSLNYTLVSASFMSGTGLSIGGTRLS